MMGLGGDDDKMENGGSGGGGGGFFESFKVLYIPLFDVVAVLLFCMYDDWRNSGCFCFFIFFNSFGWDSGYSYKKNLSNATL